LSQLSQRKTAAYKQGKSNQTRNSIKDGIKRKSSPKAHNNGSTAGQRQIKAAKAGGDRNETTTRTIKQAITKGIHENHGNHSNETTDSDHSTRAVAQEMRRRTNTRSVQQISYVEGQC
jgi:hypothetical protein